MIKRLTNVDSGDFGSLLFSSIPKRMTFLLMMLLVVL